MQLRQWKLVRLSVRLSITLLGAISIFTQMFFIEECYLGLYWWEVTIGSDNSPVSKVYGAYMRITWGRQDPARWAPWWPNESCYLGAWCRICNKPLSKPLVWCSKSVTVLLICVRLTLFFECVLKFTDRWHVLHKTSWILHAKSLVNFLSHWGWDVTNADIFDTLGHWLMLRRLQNARANR